MTKIAALDIGTNSIHMVLAEVQPDGSFKILDRFKDMTRLGDGAFTAHRLMDEAMNRGLGVIRNLVTLAHNKGYDRIVAVATSAVREAKNGGVFIGRVAREAGLRVRVITGAEEGRLIFLGVKNSIALPERPVLVVDVGGGSVELMVGHQGGMLHAKSLKLGAIRLKDLFLTRTPPSRIMLKQLQTAVHDQLQSAFAGFKTKQFDALIATSGMAGNLAEIIHLRRTGRPVPQLNLATFSIKELRALELQLAQSSIKARLAISGLDPKRVDTLFPAATVLRTLMDLTGKDDLTICDKAIREGVIYDFIERHREGIRAELEIPDVRRRNVLALARRCHAPEGHALHVATLALQLFDQTRPLHGLGPRERDWLEYSSILHDIGYVINVRQHHKHAYYLIKHSDIAGLTAEEIDIIANVARYHRRSVPSKNHSSFESLSVAHQRTVRILAACLRIADALDRSHFGVVENIEVKLGRAVRIVLHVSGDVELETWAARARADLFEQCFDRRVQFGVIQPKDEPR